MQIVSLCLVNYQKRYGKKRNTEVEGRGCLGGEEKEVRSREDIPCKRKMFSTLEELFFSVWGIIFHPLTNQIKEKWHFPRKCFMSKQASEAYNLKTTHH